VESNRYLLCNKDVETIHLCITCKVVQRLWVKCDIWLGISSVRSSEVDSHFCRFSLNFFSVKASNVWKGLWLALTKEI